MKISIAMATFNGAGYLQAQLDSFSRQTRPPDELVVSDDSSWDGTLEILERFRHRAGFPIRICRNATTLGYRANFEQVLSMCMGDVVFLSDQDDVWFDSKLEEMSAVLEQDPDLQVVLADMILTDSELRPSRYTQLGNIIDCGMPEASFVAGCATALRRRWLDLALPIPAGITAHDNWIHRLAHALDARAVVHRPLQYYRRHGDNVSAALSSHPERITTWRAMLHHGLEDSTQAWSEELERVLATRKRIAEAGEILKALGLLGRQEQALQRLDAQSAAIVERIRSCRAGRLSRLPSVLGMLMRGRYRHFSGWKSAIKDIVRP